MKVVPCFLCIVVTSSLSMCFAFVASCLCRSAMLRTCRCASSSLLAVQSEVTFHRGVAVCAAWFTQCNLVGNTSCVAAGLAYFVIKHLVDKYNMLFVHPRDYESG